MSEFDGETEFIESVARELRAPVVLSSALDQRVMSDVRVTPYAAVRTRRLWLLRPVTFRITPLGGLLAAAGIAAVTVIGAMAMGVSSGDVDPAAAPPFTAGRELPVVEPVSNAGAQHVVFAFVAPAASNVSLVGEFNDWDTGATPLSLVDSRGVWSVTLPLRPGRYLYMFVVDGTRWAPDPAAPVAPDDGFGVPNSVVTVGGAST